MYRIVILAAIVAVACAKPAHQGVSLSQDTLGNYNLKFNTDDVDRDEQGFQGGKVVGSYSYTDKEGQHHKVNYVASPNGGFVASGDVPQQVQETPEVAAARRVHLATVEKERASLPPLREEPYHEVHEVVYVPTLPVHHSVHESRYVDNTAELEAARAEHFAAHKHALDNLAQEYRRLASF
ncbi:uncharacterized protein [Atheta coriaria]|uniref:uncharacterized protein n=1 Tax=Dalotia coriaria TaxID=877792 RepID=UPI0031F46DD2